MKKNPHNENLHEIFNRISTLKGVRREKEIAALVGISHTNFSNLKQRGNLIPRIVDWALREKIDVNWLLTGEGEAMTEKIEPYGRYPDPDEDAIDKPESKVIPYYIGETRGMDENLIAMEMLLTVLKSDNHGLIEATKGMLKSASEAVSGINQMPKKREEAA